MGRGCLPARAVQKPMEVTVLNPCAERDRNSGSQPCSNVSMGSVQQFKGFTTETNLQNLDNLDALKDGNTLAKMLPEI